MTTALEQMADKTVREITGRAITLYQQGREVGRQDVAAEIERLRAENRGLTTALVDADREECCEAFKARQAAKIKELVEVVRDLHEYSVQPSEPWWFDRPMAWQDAMTRAAELLKQHDAERAAERKANERPA